MGKQQTRLRTTIETIEEAVANDAVEATKDGKRTMEKMVRAMGSGITKLEEMYQEH